MFTPAIIVNSLAATIAAVAITPTNAQIQPQSMHALLAREVIDKIASDTLTLRELHPSPTGDDNFAKRALGKDHHSLRREAPRALQQEVVEMPPETSESEGGIEVADLKAELLAELANLDAYVASPEFDENEAAVYQEGTIEWICDKTLGKFVAWYAFHRYK